VRLNKVFFVAKAFVVRPKKLFFVVKAFVERLKKLWPEMYGFGACHNLFMLRSIRRRLRHCEYRWLRHCERSNPQYANGLLRATLSQ
jgi:hypothetical protein